MDIYRSQVQVTFSGFKGELLTLCVAIFGDFFSSELDPQVVVEIWNRLPRTWKASYLPHSKIRSGIEWGDGIIEDTSMNKSSKLIKYPPNPSQ